MKFFAYAALVASAAATKINNIAQTLQLAQASANVEQASVSLNDDITYIISKVLGGENAEQWDGVNQTEVEKSDLFKFLTLLLNKVEDVDGDLGVTGDVNIFQKLTSFETNMSSEIQSAIISIVGDENNIVTNTDIDIAINSGMTDLKGMLAEMNQRIMYLTEQVEAIRKDDLGYTGPVGPYAGFDLSATVSGTHDDGTAYTTQFAQTEDAHAK